MTLTQAAIITKRTLVLFLLSTILGISSWVGLSYYLRYQASKIPPPEEKAEMLFGNLPSPTFPQSTVISSNFNYSIDTTTGELPTFPKFIKIYFIPQAGLSLLAPERSKELAQKFGFDNGPQIISEAEYQFKNSTDGNLNINITTGNFIFDRNIASESAEPLTTDPEALSGEVRSFLNSKINLPPELTEGKSNTTFTKNTIGDNQNATVSFWPTNIDELPVVTAEFSHGLVQVEVINGQTDETRYPFVNYIYWPIDKSTSSTYEVKTTQTAFDDLKAGKGYISLDPKVGSVSLTAIYLAYYQSIEYSPYLTPVYVFEGPGFVALVPAVKN